jgi:hypothetical protein
MVYRTIKKYLTSLITGPRLYMGGGKAKTNNAPDPYATAAAQFQQNKDQANFEARLNRYTQKNPLGEVSWINSGTPDNPNWTQNTTLSPEQQSLYNSQMGTQNNLATQAGNYANRMPGMLSSDPQGGDLATRQHVEAALMERLNPYLEQDRQALNTQLANQGLTYGGEAYGRAQQDMSRRVNDARLAVIGAGGDEMARAQQMENIRRNQGLTELSALMQGSGNVNLPAYGGGTTISGGAAPDIAGLINANYQAQLSQANAGQSSKNGLMGGGMSALGSLGGAAISKSDKRLKQDIEKVGQANGHNLYEFSYKDNPEKRYRGVMAQEVIETNPDAVVLLDDGYLAVDYGLLGLQMVEL